MEELYEHLQDWKGSPDGAKVIAFKKGDKTPIPASLVEVAIEEKWAKKIKTTAAKTGGKEGDSNE